jgi:hypothetical protein
MADGVCGGAMRGKNAKLWLLAALALVAAGAGAALLASQYIESYEVEEDVGYGGAARLNPYLAAEMLLNEMDLPTVSRLQRGPLPSPGYNLVILGQDAESQTRLDPQLLEWIGQGGHLVLVADPRLPSPLLDVVGIGIKEYQRTMSVPNATSAGLEASPAPQCIPDQWQPVEPWTEEEGLVTEDQSWNPEGAGSVLVLPPGSEAPLTVRTALGWTLFNSQTGEMGCLADGSAFCPFVRTTWGSGSVTALVDPAFMNNREIGSLDHAQATYKLLGGPRRPAGVVLVIRATAPGLWQLLWQRAWTVIITAALLLACWVWLASRRFGPLQGPPPPRRRSLQEHIEATGTFLWRLGQRELLLDSTRQAVRRRIATRLGTMPDTEDSGLEQAIVDRMGERPSLVRHAFHGRAVSESRGSAKSYFLQTVRQLEKLWSKR